MLCDRVKKCIELSGLNLSNFAKKSSIPQPGLHRIVAGKTPNPRMDTLVKIAETAGVDLVWLQTGAGDPFNGRSVPARSEEVAAQANELKFDSRRPLEAWEMRLLAMLRELKAKDPERFVRVQDEIDREFFMMGAKQI